MFLWVILRFVCHLSSTFSNMVQTFSCLRTCGESVQTFLESVSDLFVTAGSLCRISFGSCLTFPDEFLTVSDTCQIAGGPFPMCVRPSRIGLWSLSNICKIVVSHFWTWFEPSQTVVGSCSEIVKDFSNICRACGWNVLIIVGHLFLTVSEPWTYVWHYRTVV